MSELMEKPTAPLPSASKERCMPSTPGLVHGPSPALPETRKQLSHRSLLGGQGRPRTPPGVMRQFQALMPKASQFGHPSFCWEMVCSSGLWV